MKTLIIYFSYSGNNRLLAEYLAKHIKCDICPIIEKKRRTMLTIILDMVFKREPKIMTLEYSVSEYDHIVLIAPIWDSKLANPMKTLIKSKKNYIRSYSFITLCGYERSGQRESIEKELFILNERKPKAVLELKISDLLPSESKNQIKLISRYHITNRDLSKFETQVNEFIGQTYTATQ